MQKKIKKVAYHKAGYLVLSLSERYGQKYDTTKLIHIKLNQVKGLSFFPNIEESALYPKARNKEEYLKLKTEGLKVIGGIISEKVFCKNDISLFMEKDFAERKRLGWRSDLIKFHKIMNRVYSYENEGILVSAPDTFKKEFVQSQIEYLRNSPKLQKQIKLVKIELLKKKEIKGQDLEDLLIELNQIT